METKRFHGCIAINTSAGEFLTARRVCLLEAIDAHGSLNAAAKALPMSYRSAWESLESMNRIARRPLIKTVMGGSRGGGTTLTSYGRGLVAMFRAAERECQCVIGEFLPGVD
jgi:molybdate transport system regulatory protein